jgi:hypothetical protein
MISDRDPQFTSHFGKALTQKLGIKRNICISVSPTNSIRKNLES